MADRTPGQITRKDARALALKEVTPSPEWVAAEEALVRHGTIPPREPTIIEIIDELTLELPFAWVFFHGCRQGPIIGGKGPIIVSRQGRVTVTYCHGDDYIDVYLRKFGTLGLGPFGPRESR